ncbi:MAG: hypothetical protein ABIB47_00675 [Candidatus Woesearchaeota archaeon]
MYEVEIRALVKDFDDVKKKLDGFATPTSPSAREVTIFFFNPYNDNYDIRLILRKNKFILGYKEKLSKKARKEIESDISNPDAIYDLLTHSGFEIRMIVARVKYLYQYENYKILLNRIIDWGDAIEVEILIEEEKDVDIIEKNIKNFMLSKLEISELLENHTLQSMNGDYCKKINFNNILLKDLLDYVYGKKNDLRFI